MKNNKNLKIKILLSLITLIILSVITYISLPYISYALENTVDNFLENVGKINIPANSTETTNQIHEHRGYGIMTHSKSATEAASYKAAEGNTGIQNIKDYLTNHMNNENDYLYGWLYSLQKNTSIFCQEMGVPFPNLNNKYLKVFHGESENKRIDTNSMESGAKQNDYLELWNELSCTHNSITALEEDYPDDGIEPKTTTVYEKDLIEAGTIRKMVKYYQFTLVRVNYTASPRNFDTVESYIFTYSLRNWYTYNPAQAALWQYRNGKMKGYAQAKGLKLYKAAMAVDELESPETKPTKPTILTTKNGTASKPTGTVIDGSNYKIGPMHMNSYTYAYSENVKGFSGQSSLENPTNADMVNRMTDDQKELFKGIICGIVEAKVELDNGKVFYLTKDNIEYSEQDSAQTTYKNTYYESPSLHGYDFPTPNSTFYIKLPIAECTGATSVKKITMKYKWHTADGNGGDLVGKYDELQWANHWDGTAFDHAKYHCDHSYNGYACTNDDLAYNQRSCFPGDTGHTNVNNHAHDFWCETTGWCQYGSSATSTKLADSNTGTTRYTDKITSKCDFTWACGKTEHKHGVGACKCSHTHSAGCFITNCGYNSGEYDCGKTEHSHRYGYTDDCNNICEHKDCTSTECKVNSSGNTKVGCSHSHTTACCDKEHIHSDDCKHTHQGSASKGTGCYRGQNCDHDPGTSTCNNLNGCCSYTEHIHKVESCGKIHTCEKNYCIHGFPDGKHTCDDGDGYLGHYGNSCEARDWGDKHLGNCYGPKGVGTRCNLHPEADGGHRNCYKFVWEVTQETKDIHSQKLMYVKDAQVYEHNVECYIENIPLVAKVEIDKYIYDVEHAKTVTGVADDSFVANDERRLLDETTKEGNPVYVETDDYITYKIIMKNSSAFGVKIRVDDILPTASAYKFISANVGGTTLTDLSELRDQIITINATSEASITITLQVKALEGIYENRARIITRNGTPKNTTDDIDYIRTVDDNGPVVNHVETTCNGTTNAPEWESSDWFILNNYNTFIDKYVYKYDEAKQKENNNTLLITNESSIVGANNILKETRLNTNTTTKKVSDGNLEDTIRVNNGTHEEYKSNHPVNVEKYEKVTYAIRVSNDATKVTNTHATGDKTATKFKVSIVEDKLHNGLEYKSIKATIFKADGSKRVENVLGIGCSLVGTEGEYNVYNITTSDTTVLNAGEYIEFYMEVKVVQSNMYLYEMKNEAKIKKISNINDIDVTTRNISEQKETTEFVRMKDLVISGKVWLDFNKDGLMNDSAESDLDKINNNINDNAMKEDVLVRLYQIDSTEKAKLVRTTRTDENGLYTFARNESLTWYSTYNNTIDYSEGTKYQRIDKASNKDATSGNYTSSSEYYRYYVEFVYDGVVYKSTEAYAGMDNLTKNDGRYNEKYPIDSNAAELEKDRENFNKHYQYISYDIAYDVNGNKQPGGDLEFQKDGHNSILMENQERAMTSKSFILKYNAQEVLNACKTAMNNCAAGAWKQCSNHWKHWQIVIAMGLIDDSKYPNTADGREAAKTYLKNIYDTLSANMSSSGNTQLIKYLWLYSFNSGVDRTTPETDYLKYINLGLELREDVDLALSKDVYSVKTTINGEEMEYDYNLGETLNYTNPYIVSKPYGFEVYEADYKYRVEQYISRAVEQFKGNGADELNIEVTYRINLKNMNTPDLKGGSTNTPLDVKVHEVLDLYDQNFMDATAPAITAKVKDANGALIDKQIPTAEAWMFMTTAEAAGKELLDDKTYSIRKSEVEGGKSTYVLDADDGDYVKVKLNVASNTDGYSTKKVNNFTTDGYKTSYITGMGGILIPEGSSIDIYVKYVLDKDKLEITVDENYEKTQTADVRKFDEVTKTSSIETVTNDNITTVITNIRKETKVLEGKNTTVTVADLHRSIKLAEKIDTEFKNKFGRGTENIAQINAYSVWYTDGNPASLVDKNSNAGNIGIKNTSVGKSPNGSGYSETTTSADDIAYYEDMTYKTGIEIVAEGTENTRDVVEEIYDERIVEDIVIIEEREKLLTRRITGTIWDDSRSSVMGNEAPEKETAQYIGNGIYNPGGDGKINQAKANDNVKLNYKESSITEDTDIAVRNAKAEFVEIINIDGKYYEETLTNVTWDHKQSARTEDDGTYELYGLMPGTYVVRFTYGDYIDIPEDLSGLSQEQKDMLIFNGQDYKSTKYTGADESLDSYLDADKIIVEFNTEHESDARDDEIRRLEVNNYSEIMTNDIAEILKGLANGTELTPNSSKNNSEELKSLAENTYMIADTREFLVKPEKLLDKYDGVSEAEIQKTDYKDEYMYSDSLPFYKYFTSMKNKHIEKRNYAIKNVDFGIEYRPESEISLLKEIVQLTLITEDNETLVDLHFETKNDGGQITHEINKDKSIGYDLVQFITNNYKPKTVINNIVSEENIQGLVYIQVDEEILQGCTVKITYGFNAQNCSEVDRISTKLNEIRYKYNKATQELINDYKTKYSETKELAMVDLNNIANDSRYTASALAKAVVFADTYNVDDEGIVYREIAKKLTTDGKDGYYGRYVGQGYYTGDLSNLDTIASLKFDKILDYIDTNLEYEQKSTSEEVIDRLWSKITSRELISLVSHYKDLRQAVGTMSDDELPKVTDIDGIEYKSMVVSVDDRNVDSGDDNEIGDRANAIKNKDISRFLIPKVTAVGLYGNDDLGKQYDEEGKLGYDDYTGHIYLEASKVLAAGSDEDDKTYENIAEIVQFTTLNGRRTNFATTIGNANIHEINRKIQDKEPPFNDPSNTNSGSIEFITASFETDTSATETITLIPPTGLMKNRRAIVSIMETAKAGVEVISMTGLVVAIIAGVVFLVILAIRKYKKRRIK